MFSGSYQMTTIKAIGKELVLKSDQNISLYPQDNIWVSQGTKLIFEGTVPDNFEAKLQATTVTADRDIILPDSDGTIATQEWVNLQGFGGGGSAITIQDEGSALSTAATIINFVGTGVVASGNGATKTITISGGSGIAEVSSDTTPQLGGNLDLNTNDITGTGDVTITGTVTATDFASSGSGTPTLSSSTSIVLDGATGISLKIGSVEKASVSATGMVTDIMTLTPLAAEPTTPTVGMIVVADKTNWDPLTSGGTRPYVVFYDGAIWTNLSSVA